MARLSVNTIISSVIGNLGLRNVSEVYDDFVRWAFEAEKKIGSFDTFLRLEARFTVANNRLLLPTGYISMIAVKQGNNMLEYTNKDFTQFGASPNISVSNDTGGIPNYSIQNGYIFFESIADGEVDLSWMGVGLDADGLPTILDTHEDAVAHYLMFMYKSRDYYRGKLPQAVYRDMKLRWIELCNEARGDDEMPDAAQYAKLAEAHNQLLKTPNKNLL